MVHRHESPDQRALEELKALRQLGTPRQKLLELFGPNGLDRIEDARGRRDRAARRSRQGDRREAIGGSRWPMKPDDEAPDPAKILGSPARRSHRRSIGKKFHLADFWGHGRIVRAAAAVLRRRRAGIISG